MSKSKENSTHYLCPGKDHFLSEQKKSKDLSPEMFKKLVTRRIREVNPDEEYAMPETEDERRSFEAILEKISGESNFLPVSFLFRIGPQRNLPRTRLWRCRVDPCAVRCHDRNKFLRLKPPVRSVVYTLDPS